MTDTERGRRLRFGVSLDPAVAALAETRRLARLADDAGLDYLAVQDHPYLPGHLDAWTLISHLAAGTERAAFVTGVADLPLRPAPMLAKAAASLGVLTGGTIMAAGLLPGVLAVGAGLACGLMGGVALMVVANHD